MGQVFHPPATTLSITTFNIMTFSIMTFSIMTFSIMTLSIVIKNKKNATQHNGRALLS
jgi:hypothetical protein